MYRNPHQRQDHFSLLLHREAAAALVADERLFDRAEQILLRWKARHGMNAPRDWDVWLGILNAANGRAEAIKMMTSEDERATRLRQSSPFSTLVSQRRRLEILRGLRDDARAT